MADWSLELSKLISELFEIGKNEGFYSEAGGANYFRNKHIRARKIGENIAELEKKYGYENIELMSHAHAAICQEFDTGKGDELSFAWDYVGRWQV